MHLAFLRFLLALLLLFPFFFFIDTATSEIYTLSYTTLFRSHSRFPQIYSCVVTNDRDYEFSFRYRGHRKENRSEEHTSELQSRQYLVCRLLLEKKKTFSQIEVAESRPRQSVPRRDIMLHTIP